MENKNNGTALLVMDMQPFILKNLPDPSAVLDQVASAIRRARAASVPVIYVGLVFREGMPEISDSNKSFNAARDRFSKFTPGDFLQIHPDVKPMATEPIAFKKRISGFTGSDLEILLRSGKITHIVLTGVATSGVVLSTLREAADKDFRITVLSDACADADEEVHRVLTTKVFPRQAEVTTVAEWNI